MLKGILTALYVIMCLGVIASVLMQSGKSAGLSGTIAGGAEQLFGKKKGMDETLSKVTTVVSILFMVLALVLIIIS